MKQHRTTITDAPYHLARRLPFVAGNGSLSGRYTADGTYLVVSLRQKIAWAAPGAPMTFSTSPCGPIRQRHARIVREAVQLATV